MSRLTDLLGRAAALDPQLGADLDSEFRVLADRRAFGLNFERHQPEAVELPGRPVRKGDKVRLLPARGTVESGDSRLWRVTKVDKQGDTRIATVKRSFGDEPEETSAGVDDLVVVAEFRDPIYPGLISTGTVERGGDKPFHTVINGENFHALQTLLYTHRGKVDCIYIDPPYNTGAKDWKYNNDYVEGDDLYRHSKWLAFMERRLILARELLNADDSVLIVTIDEKEYLRLGLLLEQVFPECSIQMASIVINPSGSVRPGRLTRTDEFAFFVFVGSAMLSPHYVPGAGMSATGPLPKVWETAIRSGSGTGIRPSRPNLFYPVFVEPESLTVHSVGNPLPLSKDRNSVSVPDGTVAIWPLGREDREQTWAMSDDKMRQSLSSGTARIAKGKRGPSVLYMQTGVLKRIEQGTYKVTGKGPDGSLQLAWGDATAGRAEYPRTTWNMTSHSASSGGTRLLSALLGDRAFPYPKSVYAVEDALRYVVGQKPDALVVDFFAGSGTTAHAVMRLNKQDSGRRKSVSVTNNEVSAEEQRGLRQAGLRPGDPEWEERGICDYITKPRIRAAVTGLTPMGEPIKGDYKFTDEFPMADGFEENVEFFTLTYNSPAAVGHNRAFGSIAPLLWLRAGAVGRRIDSISAESGWDVSQAYGVLVNLDIARAFVKAIAGQPEASVAFIVTDDDRRFQMICRSLPEHVQPVRLYESYFLNFEINTGDAS